MPGTEEQLTKEVTTGYIGFDPTSDSVQTGSAYFKFKISFIIIYPVISV
jgi:tyrosyl-tRNA synthetase